MGRTISPDRRSTDRSLRRRLARPGASLLVAAVLATPLTVASNPPAADAATAEYLEAWSRQRPGQAEEVPSIEEMTDGMERLDGFMPLYWDTDAGQLWMEIPEMGIEVLNMQGLAAGLGSNDIGLDRGQSGGDRVVRFDRVGPKVFMVQPNFRYRSSSDNPEEVEAVEDAFARSIVWGFQVAAETDGRVLVDMNEYLLRDSYGIAPRLRPGNYRLDTGRSAVYRPMTENFPENTELEVTLTFVRQEGGGGGGFGGFGGGAFEGVNDVAASGEAATLRVHHSFVQLPEPGYEPRAYDPRAGYGGHTYEDYSVPLGEPLTQRFIRRHRLEKVAPEAEVSEAVEPIVYYLDPGTPEPMRSALLDGARWWNQAFEAAGYQDAFRVELRPPDVSSHDVRYNVINWVHRSTRGWSYGGSVTDPRTGEIIKGVVTLGSLRVRQDYMIAEGLLAPYENGDEDPDVLAEWALARIRQLSAHEVGHTIGLGHNYYDSSLGRISVMDYPHPLVRLEGDSLDTSEVYDVGIGEWDEVAVAYGYQDFPEGTDEDEGLQVILDEAWQRDVRYMSNQDTALHPKVDQWSNGTDAGAELDRMMEVRRWALTRFGERVIQNGEPLALMEEVLVPLYLHHRYQVTAAASVLGGIDYIYTLRGDGRQPMEVVSADVQMATLDALLATLTPAALAVPRDVLEILPPRPSGYGGNREMFPRYTDDMFDAVTPAVVAADHVVGAILEPDRAARLVEQAALDPAMPGLDTVISRVNLAAFEAETTDAYEAEIARAVQRVVVDNLMRLAAEADMPQVRAVATLSLEEIRQQAAEGRESAGSAAERAHLTLLARDVDRFLSRPADSYTAPDVPSAPPGAPIGQPAMVWVRPANPLRSLAPAPAWVRSLADWCSISDWRWGWEW